MKHETLNPLMLLIMTQAWCHVKRHTASQTGDQNTLENADNSADIDDAQAALLAACASDAPTRAVFSPDAWRHVWSHPFFKGSMTSDPLSIRQLARCWGQPGSGLVCLSDWTELADITNPPRAIKIDWNTAWKSQWPSEWMRLLEWKNAAGTQIWIDIPATPEAWASLHDSVCRTSVQMGWSWWCTPPGTVDKFPEYLKAYRPFLKYWLTNPQSDQWVWPWGDIVIKKVTEHLLGRQQDRHWISDQRQKQAWQKLDEEVWSDLEKMMGGPSAWRALIAAVHADLDRIDFLDRPFNS